MCRTRHFLIMHTAQDTFSVMIFGEEMKRSLCFGVVLSWRAEYVFRRQLESVNGG